MYAITGPYIPGKTIVNTPHLVVRCANVKETKRDIKTLTKTPSVSM